MAEPEDIDVLPQNNKSEYVALYFKAPTQEIQLKAKQDPVFEERVDILTLPSEKAIQPTFVRLADISGTRVFQNCFKINLSGYLECLNSLLIQGKRLYAFALPWEIRILSLASESLSSYGCDPPFIR